MDPSEENDKLLEDINNKKITEYAPAITYSVFVIVIGIIGNIFSIAYYGFKSHKTSTNLLITALATTDLIACIVFCDEIIELCFTIAFKNVIGCKIMYFTNHSIVFISGFILFLICLDRFQKICRRQSWQMTMKGAKIGIGVVVTFCCIISVRDFVILDVVRVNLTSSMDNMSVTGYYCTNTRDENMKPIVTAFQLLDFALFLILIPAMFVLYLLVAKEILKHRKKKENHPLAKTKASASTSDSRHTEGSTEMSAIEATSSDIKKNTDNYSEDEENRDVHVIPTVSDMCSRKHTYEVTQSSGKITLDPLKRVLKGNAGQQGKGHHSRETHSASVERKIAIMMIATTVGSILSFVPYFIVNLTVKRNSNTPEQEFSVGMQIALRSFMLNNAINPYIMGIFNTKFKQFVKNVFCTCRR